MEKHIVCGLFAVFSKSKIEQTKAKSCCRYLENRGPDNFGFEQISSNHMHTFLGHARLSIVDETSSSNQPFSLFFNSQTYTMIFNGELYNYLELKHLLADKYSYTCETSGDTEIILASYAFMGEACFNLFDGVWSVVILVGNKIVVSRDRLGEKPLYKLETGDALIFSSQITPILEYVEHYELNFNEVNAVTLFGYHGDILETCFKSIYQVAAGTYETYTCSFGRFTKRASALFWNITDYVHVHNSLQHNSEAEHLQDLIIDSVLARVPRDVPFSLTLSGGVDSTILAYILTQNHKKFETFTNVFSDKNFAYQNESVDVEKTVDELNLKANYVELSYNDPQYILQIYEEKINNYESPISDIGLSGYCVYNTIREHGFKVVLEGQGADEIFGGYESYRGPFTAMRSNLLTLAFRVLKNEVNRHEFILKYANIKRFYKYYITKTIQKRAHLLDIELSNNFIDYLVEREFTSLPDFRKRENINKFICAQIQRNLSYLLFTGDRDSMLHGVESRLPFTNHHLVEFALRQPSKFFMTNGILKVGLKKAVQNIVPSTKLYRQKRKIGYPDAFDHQLSSNTKFRSFFNNFLVDSQNRNSVCDIENINLYRPCVSRKLFLERFS